MLATIQMFRFTVAGSLFDRWRTATIPNPPAWTALQRKVLLTAVVIGLVLGWIGREADVLLGGDEATYITLSHSLEAGRYRDEFLVGTPRHAQYPPGNPAWILAIRTVTGDSDLDAVLAVNLLAIAAASLLVADALRRLGSATIGTAVGAATAVNPILGEIGGTALSEAPYIFFTSVALWATVSTRSGRTRPRLALATVFALLALLTRSIGLSVIAAVVVAVLRRARIGTILATIALSTAVVAWWFWYTTSVGSTTIGHTYATDLAHAPQHIGEAIHHAAVSAKDYFFRIPAYQLGVPDIPGTNLDTQLLAAGLAVLLVAGFLALIGIWPEAATMLLGSTAILLVWPWPVMRLMNPLIPWTLAAVCLGTADIAARLGAKNPRRFVVALSIVIAGLGVMNAATRAIRTAGCRSAGPYTDEACFHRTERDFVRAADFVRDSVPSSAVIYTTKPSVVYVLTGRQGLPLQSLDADEFERFLNGGRGSHVIISALAADDYRAAFRVIEARCHEVTAPKVLSRALVLTPRIPTSRDPDACPALMRFSSAVDSE